MNFQDIALESFGKGPSHALSPERLSPAFPFGEYMYELKSPLSRYVTQLEKQSVCGIEKTATNEDLCRSVVSVNRSCLNTITGAGAVFPLLSNSR